MSAGVSTLRNLVSVYWTPRRKLWLSRLRHGELAWQQRCRALIPATLKLAGTGPPRGYDALQEMHSAVAAVRSVLAETGIDAVELPRVGRFHPTLVVEDAARAEALSALLGLPEANRWRVNFSDVRGASVRARRARAAPAKVSTAVCRRRVDAPNGRELSTEAESVTVEFWRIGKRRALIDGSEYEAGTLHRPHIARTALVEHIQPREWREAVALGSATLRLPAPHLYTVTEPVDLVYTWVDGGDSKWRTRMERARNQADVTGTATSEARFTSRDELRYSLRSVEYYASWFNHIYIVTDRQVPQWLNIDHPRVTVVDHRDIFRRIEDLPVFNSHSIESQIHRIPGLSKHYLYMNDDVFFARPVSPELFFTGNGLSKFFPSIVPLGIGSTGDRDLPVVSAAKHGRDRLIAAYGRTVTHRFKHTPHPQLREVLESMESEDPEMFSKVAGSRFRSAGDYSIPASLYHFEAYARGRAVPGHLNYQFIDLMSEDLDLRLQRTLRRDDLDVVCLNETDSDPIDKSRIDESVAWFMESRFPVPSHFEVHRSEESRATIRGQQGVGI